MKSTARKRLLLSALLVLVAGVPLAAAREGTGEPERLLKAVRSSKPDPGGAVRVENLLINMGPGALVIDDGVLVPAEAAGGRSLEIAFTGNGWFRFSTSDPVESGQVKLFTGGISLMTPITQAVLIAGNEEAFARALKGAPAEGPRVREAAALFKDWIRGAERQGFGADIAMVKALRDEPDYRDYFAIWCRSPDHGDFYYIIDPSLPEPVLLGQFVPADLSGMDVWQQRRFKNYMRRVKFFSRFSEFSMEHPGRWDTWVSTGLEASSPQTARVDSRFEPEHYTLDLYVNPSVELDARGKATIRLRARSAGARSISFHLYPGLLVRAVSVAGGAALDYIQREGALHVFLPEAVTADETLEVSIEYKGDLLEPLRGGDVFALLDTMAWYPRTGAINRATYDVTLRRPERFDLLASGTIVENGVENHAAWERRTLDLPSLGFTFELGYFDIVREKVGHVEVTFGFPREEEERERAARPAIIETVRDSLPYFEAQLGPYPLDYLTVVTAPRDFSQGLLSMLTLATRAVRDPWEEATGNWRKKSLERRALTIAHELSHQWWGNWVGWSSYRDQWLSEALANYSALQYGAGRAERRAAFMARNAHDWKSSLTRTTSDGRTLASLGPVTMGVRLNSSKSKHGYQAVVYDKGDVIFRMLSKITGEEALNQMLGALSRAVANRTLDTGTFLKALERMSGLDLQGFSDQFVYGTGIPEVYYRYEVEPIEEDEGWMIRGEARQVGTRRTSFTVAPDELSGWSVRPDISTEVDVPYSTLVVPYQVILTPPEEINNDADDTIQSARGLGGRLLFRGESTPFTIKVPEKPEKFELDQNGEVLAIFHDAGWKPKRTLRIQARNLDIIVDGHSVEEMLRKALSAPYYSERALAWMHPEGSEDFDQEALEKHEDARIRTVLAGLLVHRGDLEGAETELAAAEALLEKPGRESGWRERILVRSRIDLARDDARAAYKRLKREKRRRWWLGTEGNALLAVAAHLTGHRREAEAAMDRAESGGVDVRLLRQSAAGRTAP